MNLNLDPQFLAEFCKRNRIASMALFGSALTDRFGATSDVDLLVTFEPGAHVGFMEMSRIEIELGTKLGRRVDLRTPKELSPIFREKVMVEARPLYAS